MLLAADVGNSTSVFGLFDDDRLIRTWRIVTVDRTADEYELLLEGLLAGDVAALTGCVVASVVPFATESLRTALQRLVGEAVVVVGPGTRSGLRIAVDNPREVGADRIATAIGAIDRHGAPVITVDFGTATTIDLVVADGSYVGGAIVPGVRVAAEALVEATSALRRVEIAVPRHVVGKSTVEAMQSGLTYGFAGLVDGLVDRIRSEHDLDDTVPVIATGGLASVMAPIVAAITVVEEDLTLWGLRIVFERNPT
jgi:type III pantothenate kinase